MSSIFVTGAGKGIGRAIVTRFAGSGWDVSGVTRSADDVADLNESVGRFWQADACDAATVAAIAESFQRSGLDLLVNNAGGFAFGGFRETSAEMLETLWRSNVVSAFTVTQAMLPALLHAKGMIANIVSIAALKPLANKAAYSATKAAQAALFRCLRDEVASEGVTVTNIHPGVTFTNSFAGEEVDPATLMSAEDVAEAVFRNCTMGGNLVVEELTLQPARGVRL